MKVDHIGIAVADLDAAAAFYGQAFGIAVSERYDLPHDGVRAAFLDAGDVLIELLQPLDEAGPVARFLQRRGEGLHHIALLVPDVVQALDEARAQGRRLIDERPRPGAGGRLIAFLHPKTSHGVLIELIQAAQVR